MGLILILTLSILPFIIFAALIYHLYISRDTERDKQSLIIIVGVGSFCIAEALYQFSMQSFIHASTQKTVFEILTSPKKIISYVLVALNLALINSDTIQDDFKRHLIFILYLATMLFLALPVFAFWD